jgi:hypothetical protein
LLLGADTMAAAGRMNNRLLPQALFATIEQC